MPPAKMRAVGHHFKTGDHHQERALAATARAEQADEFALLDGERSGGHSLERGRTLSEHLAYALAADLRLLHAIGRMLHPMNVIPGCRLLAMLAPQDEAFETLGSRLAPQDEGFSC